MTRAIIQVPPPGVEEAESDYHKEHTKEGDLVLLPFWFFVVFQGPIWLRY